MPALARGLGVDVVITNHDCVAWTTTNTASRTVFCEGINVHRVGDKNTPHSIGAPPCPLHTTVVAVNSTQVYADGQQVARDGDAYVGTEVIRGVQQISVFVDGY